jgi:hypothetical protein
MLNSLQRTKPHLPVQIQPVMINGIIQQFRLIVGTQFVDDIGVLFMQARQLGFRDVVLTPR